MLRAVTVTASVTGTLFIVVEVSVDKSVWESFVGNLWVMANYFYFIFFISTEPLMCAEICFQSGLLFVLCLLLAVFISQQNVSSFFKRVQSLYL